MENFEIERKNFISLIQRWHADHPRRGGSQIDHCMNVMRWLEDALDREHSPVKNRRFLVLAALGHDLYEDSMISPAEIITGYGREVDALIRELTEEGGINRYVEQIASGSEEARLIKFCDGIDNYGSLVETRLTELDPIWAVGIVRHQMEPMFTRLLEIPFAKYPCAGAWLIEHLIIRRAQFWGAIGGSLSS